MTTITKRILASLVLLLAMTSPLYAAMEAVDAVPAATLLQPYFEVSYLNANGPRTVLTVGNVTSAERLAHVTLWTDRGVPAYTFDIRLDAAGTKEIDLTALFRTGTPPQSTPGGFGSCAGTLPTTLNSTQLNDLRRAFRGQSSSLFGGECGGVNYSQDVARGYVTIDATSACTTMFPNQPGYFVNGGTGIATNDNVLWGEAYTSEVAGETAYGTTMVHIEAGVTPLTDGVPGPVVYCSMNPCPPNPYLPLEDYTFYSRMNGNGADNREGLPQEWWGRYEVNEARATSARIWRDPGSVEPFPCAASPANLSTGEIAAFDDRENPAIGPNPIAPYATQQIALSVANVLSPGLSRGIVRYNLALTSSSGALSNRNQGYVSHVHRDGTRRSESPTIAGNYPASGPAPFVLIPTQSFPCSDGLDNDSDGLIDYPNDPGCRSADSFVENPGCNDGQDNDSDGSIDYPADSDCHSGSDAFEADYNPQCDDGIDNDGDGKIDYPADGGCFNVSSNNEGADACRDGFDNDGDGRIDYPADPGCANANSSTESPVCSDGLDNDGDGRTDFPNDPGCSSASSTTEAPQCNDGISNDADGLIDYPNDPGCASASSSNESPQCNNGTDNDGDGLIDMDDPGCLSPSDTQEFATQCNDGRDNDLNGVADYPNDPSCLSPDDDAEIASCNDGEDNDCDGLSDASDPGCANGLDPTETPGLNPQCSDGIDNDGDGYFDFPSDPGCESRADDIEYNPGQAPAAVAAIPSLSTWGLMLMAALLGLVAMVTMRGSMNG